MSQNDSLSEEALRRHAAPPPVPAGADAAALTARERELVRLLGRGLTNRQIGEALCISEWTVKTHVQNLREKFQVHTRAAVVALSWEVIREVGKK